MGLQKEAARQNRSVFELSSVMAMSALSSVPKKAQWLSTSVRLAAGKTGTVMLNVLLDHYQTTLRQIHERGYVKYAVQQYRPYLRGAVLQFSPRRRTLTERLFVRKKAVKDSS